MRRRTRRLPWTTCLIVSTRSRPKTIRRRIVVMTDTPPYLISYDFGQNWIPVPQDLWPYFGAVDDCSQILDGMLAFPNTQASMTDGTNMFGALFIELRNPDNVAIWLNQGYVTSPTGSFLEFAGGLFDRQTNPNV